MRLIDADALMERFAEMQKMGKTDGTEYACNFMSAGQEPSAEWYTIEDAVENAPTVDAMAVDKVISAIQEIIESIDEDFPLLDFNSRYMMERGMRMSLIQIKKLSADGERKGGDE